MKYLICSCLKINISEIIIEKNENEMKAEIEESEESEKINNRQYRRKKKKVI